MPLSTGERAAARKGRVKAPEAIEGEEGSGVEIFRYGKAEIDHLKRRDKKLGAAIDMIGAIEREIRPDPLEAATAIERLFS